MFCLLYMNTWQTPLTLFSVQGENFPLHLNLEILKMKINVK